MLTPEQVHFLQEELKNSKNPLFFHDDDADGLCSFLLLYRIHREGRNSLVKQGPALTAAHLRKVAELNPDKIFVLDVPIVEEEFIAGAKRPIFWIDHHQPLQRQNIHYYNPRIKDPEAYIPTTRMAWQVSPRKEDLWIATAGCLADWHMPDFIDEFIEQYPHFLSKKVDLATALFKEPVGQLVKLFFFLIMGPTSEVRNSIKILTRIKSPDEIFQQQTSAGKFLYQRFKKINEKYNVLLTQAKKQVTTEKLVLFFYTQDHWSFTTNLANELAALNPDKVIIIARNKSGEMKCSLRAQFPILDAVQKALVGVQGSGGGHFNACGAVIKEEDWERFLQTFKEEIEKVQL